MRLGFGLGLASAHFEAFTLVFVVPTRDSACKIEVTKIGDFGFGLKSNFSKLTSTVVLNKENRCTCAIESE